MSKLHKYFDSRAKDKRFKLLHEESSYLSMLKGKTTVEEAEEADTVLLNEAELSGQANAAADDAGDDSTDSEDVDPAEMKETIDFTEEDIMEAWLEDTFNPDEIKEISISVARKASVAAAKKVKLLRKKRLTPGLTTKGKKPVLMGRL